MASPTPDRSLAEEELARTIDGLRLLSDQLELVLDGEQPDRPDSDLVHAIHDIAVRARHAVNEVRSIRAAEARQDTYVRLADVPLADVIVIDRSVFDERR